MTLSLTGKVFGSLTVQYKYGRIWESKVWRTQWMCKCLCGNEILKTTVALRTSKVKSCGNCQWHIKHAEAYNSWQAARQRCNTPTNKDYPRYGGRGIKMLPEWDTFVQFYLDMGDPPKDPSTGERMSLDREDNDGHYCKSNCKWSTRSEQQLNKEFTRRYK